MRIRRALVPLFALAGCISSGALPKPPSSATQPIVSARVVHDLPPEVAAREIPVHLRVVVTYYDPYIDVRHAAIFAQDASGGVFVSVPARPILSIKPGTLVDIDGVTNSGDYAAVVASDHVVPVRQATLPADPVKATMTQLMTGTLDCQWVQVQGRIRSVHLSALNAVLVVAGDGGMLTAVTVRQHGVDYDALVDSLVRIDGAAGPLFNERRQMVGVHLFFPTLNQITVIQAAPPDPFSQPPVRVSQLFRFSPDPGLLRRVHVQGTVTLNWPGRVLCIQDGKAGICMQSSQATTAPVGSFVDVVGFPVIDLFKPSLEDAVFRDTGSAPSPLQPVFVTPDKAIKSDLDGKLVQIDAELIGRDIAAPDPTLMFRAGGILFPAILPRNVSLGGALPWKDGSLVRITGVSNVQVDSLSTNLSEGAVRPESVHLLLRSLDDVTLLKAPTWWTAEHTYEAFAVVGVLVVGSFFWIVVLRHRVALQTRALRGSEERLRHLSEHDSLTGLPNRILLNDRCQNSLKRAARFHSCLGLLMVDADEFKVVNDALGHQAGDKLLCELAGRLTACVRETDTVARIGGDEFIVLLPDLRIPAEAESIAAKIVATLARPYAIDNTQAVITVSVGVVTFPEAGTDLETLMQCADEAMYTAKEKGKNSFQVYRQRIALTGKGGSMVQPPHVSFTTGGA